MGLKLYRKRIAFGKQDNCNTGIMKGGDCVSLDIETEVFRIWDSINLYTLNLFDVVCNATPYAQCLFEHGYDGFCFYIPMANKYYHIWRDGNFYHDYYFEKKELNKNDVLEILYKKKLNSSCTNGIRAKTVNEIIDYINTLP